MHSAALRRTCIPLCTVLSKGYSPLKRKQRIVATTDRFSRDNGRRPRVLLSVFGHAPTPTVNSEAGGEEEPKTAAAAAASTREDRGLAALLAQLGFDVDLCPVEQPPAVVVRHAVEADVHVLHARIQQDKAEAVCLALREALKKEEAEEEVVLSVQLTRASSSRENKSEAEVSESFGGAMVFEPSATELDIGESLSKLFCDDTSEKESDAGHP